MISIHIEKKQFANKDIILKNIHLDLQRGEWDTLSGSSGIGKTTMIRIIAGLDRDFDGRVSGFERCALMFQEPTLIEWCSLRKNFQVFYPQISNTAIESALVSIGLEGKGDLFPHQLSLGQQRRVALLRSFLSDADLLLLDEPFASLDSQTAHDMLQLTQQYLWKKKPACLIVTHQHESLKSLAHRQLQLSGMPATIISE